MDMTPGPRIMVVDDDRQELDQTLDAIRKHGGRYEARIARGGFEALDYVFGRGRFHERLRHPLPDLILLDFDMAPLDGLEVFRRMREADYLPRIPVAILCKSELERERAAQAAAGACAYLVKPMTPEGFDEILSVAGVGGHFLALPPVRTLTPLGSSPTGRGRKSRPEQGAEGLDESEDEGGERVATLRTEAIRLQRALGRDLDRVAKRRRDEQARWRSVSGD